MLDLAHQKKYFAEGKSTEEKQHYDRSRWNATARSDIGWR